MALGRHIRRLAIVALLFAGAAAIAPSAETRRLLAPGKGQVRALVIASDKSRDVNTLGRAVADAHDVTAALKTMGVEGIVSLTDNQADRRAVLRELDALLARTRRGDLVILSIAGHGAQEDERVKGSSS